METGLLLCTCGGHRAEVTDLAVNVDNTLFASSSNDHTVRCWSLEASLKPRHAPQPLFVVRGPQSLLGKLGGFV